MITVPEVVEKIIKQSPYLEETFNRGIINYSALARQIKPEVEKQTFKNVQEGAIVMALKRLSKTIKSKNNIGQVFRTTPDLMVRSNLVEITMANSESLVKKYKTLLDQVVLKQQYFLTITQGIYETTIIASQEMKDKILQIFKDEKIISQFNNLSSITVKLSKDTAFMPGAYYLILKSLAWEGINMIEVVSTFREFTIILEYKDIDRAFSVLKEALTDKR